MDIEKQKLLLSALISNRDLMALCGAIIKPSYFDATLKKSVKFTKEYFEKYKDIPRAEVVRAETGLILESIGEISRAEVKFIADEVEQFCRNRAMTEAILAGPELIQKGDFGKILETLKSAISVGLQRDLGIDYFKNPHERLIHTLETQAKISTGWPELDALLGGGVGRQELIMFAANSGGGKSMTMLNLAKNFLAQGLNGIYISLEMSEGVVSKRLDSMITKIGQDNLLKQMTEVAAKIERAAGKMGGFRIKRFPENRTNINHIRSYISQLEQDDGFVPDFIVVDYLDIMGTTHNIALDNLFVKDKFVTEEVRSLGYDFDCIMVSASQLGRNAIEADKLNQAHIQGGISKINTSDYTVAVKQDDLMRSQGEIYFEILKSRNSAGVGHRILLGWDPVSLLVTSNEANRAQLQLTKKKKPVELATDGTIFQQKNSGDVLDLLSN